MGGFTKFSFLCILIFAAISSRPSDASDPIDILVALSARAFVESNPATLRDRYQEAIDDALGATGMSSREVRVFPYLVPTIYVGDYPVATEPSFAIAFLKNKVDPLLTAARDNGVIPYIADGFDLIILVTTDHPGGSCGQAEIPLDYADSNNSETKAFATTNTRVDCGLLLVDYVIGHEFGHNLGGEHQVSGGTFPDDDEDEPVNYNHPVFVESEAYTLMASPGTIDMVKAKIQYSKDESGVLPETTVRVGSSTEDNKKLFANTTWDMVAAYRPAPQCPLPLPLATAEWEYCVGSQAVYAFDWWAGPGTVPPVTFKVQQRVGFIWYPFYEGSQTHLTWACSFTRLFKVQVVNAGCESDWFYFWANHNCADGGEPD